MREIKNVGERCPVCHGEERSDEAIHLEFQLACRARPVGLAMTNPRVKYARSGVDIARQGTAYFSGAPTWAGKPMPRGTGFPARGFGTGRTLRPSSVISRPPPVRFLRLLRVFAANPPAAVCHLSSAVCRPPSGTGLISFPSSFVSYLAPVTHSGCALGPQRCFRLRAACLRRACLTEAQKRPPWFRLVRGHEGSAE